MTTKATTNKVYGYARISTKKKSIERQIKSIKAYNEDNGALFEVRLKKIKEDKV